MRALRILVNGRVADSPEEVQQAILLAVATLMKRGGAVGPFALPGASPTGERPNIEIIAEPEPTDAPHSAS